MGKTYKVHKFFDEDMMTTAKACTCSAAKVGDSILDIPAANSTKQSWQLFENYNVTKMNGSVFESEDVGWGTLTKSECACAGNQNR